VPLWLKHNAGGKKESFYAAGDEGEAALQDRRLITCGTNNWKERLTDIKKHAEKEIN
jgi:DNA-binding PadR family transcriptional regulator